MGDFQQVLHTVIPSPPVVHTPAPPSQAPVIAPVILSVAPPSNEPVMPTFVTPTRQTVILPARTTTTDPITTTTTTNVLPTGNILPNITYQSQSIPYFIPYSYIDQFKPKDPLNISTVNALTVNVSTVNAQTINVVSTFAKNVLSDYIEATESYVYDKFTLDNQVLTANATELLLNGNPLVTANQISTLADWSKDPAISTIQANGNDLTNVRFANFSSIVADSMTVNKLTTLYSTTVETFESTITAEIQKLTVSSITGGNAYFDVLTAGSIINPSASTINCDYINVASNATFSNATFSNATFSNAPTFNQGGTFNGTRPNFNTGINTRGANNFNFTNIDNASNINGNVITIAPQNNLNVNTSNAMSVTVDRGTDIGGSANINLTSQKGGGSFVTINAKSADSYALTPASAVNITAEGNVYYGTNNPYGGAIRLTANAGLSGNTVGTTGGGAVNITAYSYNLTQPGLIRESAGSISAYSGATSPLTGVYGYSYYSALNCLSLTAGATTPSGSYPGVVYLRGDNGTKVVNGFYSDTITATGNSVLPSITGVTSINGSSYPPSFSVPDALNVSSILTSTIKTPYASISSIMDVSTINGAVYPPPSGVPSILVVSTMTVSSVTKSATYSSPNLKGLNWSQSGSLSKNWTAISQNVQSGYYYAVVNGDYIYYSANGGTTWTQQGTVQAWSGIANVTTSFAVACVAGGGIYYTTNSGTTWTLSASAPTANWSGVCGNFAGATYYACINGGGIYYSSDNGVTWTITNAPSRNWTALCCGISQAVAICSGSTTPLYRGSALVFTNVGSTLIPSGNWNSVTQHVVSFANPAPKDFSNIIIVGRNDGFNYLYNVYSGIQYILPVKGYVGSMNTGSVFYSALPLNPIQVSYDYGTNWTSSSSPSLNWSCICPIIGPSVISSSSLPPTNSINPCLAGVNGGYIYGDVPDSANATADLVIHNTTIRSDTGVINALLNSLNLVTSGTSIIQGNYTNLLGTYDIPSATGFIILPTLHSKYAPVATTTRVYQPFILYGTVTTGTTSPYTVTMSQSFANTASYMVQLTHVDTSANVICSVSNLTGNTFSIAWTGAVGAQVFNWTVFGN